MEDFQYHLTAIEELVSMHNHGPVCVAGKFNVYVSPGGGPRGLGCPNHQGMLLSEVVHNNDLFFISLGSMATGPLHQYFSGNTDYY